MCKQLAETVIRQIVSCSDKTLAELTVSGLSRQLGVDRYKLARSFKELVDKDMTLEGFLCQEKMIRAAFWLARDLEVTVKDVSVRLGFSCGEYFGRVFKKHFGICPGKYQKFKRLQLEMRTQARGISKKIKAKVPVEEPANLSLRDLLKQYA